MTKISNNPPLQRPICVERERKAVLLSSSSSSSVFSRMSDTVDVEIHRVAKAVPLYYQEGAIPGESILKLVKRESVTSLSSANLVKPTTDMESTAQLTQEVARETILLGSSSEEISLATGVHGQTAYSIGDPWGLAAGLESLVASATKVRTDPGVQNKMTSTMGLVTGPLCIYSALKTRAVAKQLGDSEEVKNQTIRLVRGGFETLNGGVMLATRAVNLAVVSSATSKTILSAQRVLGPLSSGMGCFVYSLLLAPFAYNAFRGGAFLKTLNKMEKKGHDQALNYLLDFINLNKEDVSKIVDKVFIDADKLAPALEDSITLPDDLMKVLTAQELLEIEQCVFERFEGLTKEIVNLNSRPEVQEAARNYLLAKALKEAYTLVGKKKSRYTRRAGYQSYGQLREVLRRDNVQTLSAQKKVELVECAKSEGKASLTVNTLLVITCIIGIAAIIGATVFTGGAPLIASLIVMLVANVLMTGLDLFAFIKEVEALKQTSKNDLIVQAIIAIISIASIAVGVVFATTPLALGAVVALGAFMLTFQGAAAYQVYQKLDPPAEEEPSIDPYDLANMVQMAQDGEVPPEVLDERFLNPLQRILRNNPGFA